MKNTLIKIAIIAVFIFNTTHSFAYQASDRQKSVKNSNSADVNVRRDQTNNAKKSSSSARRVIPTKSSTKEEFRKRLIKELENKGNKSATSKRLPIPALPFKGMHSKASSNVNRTDTKESNSTNTRGENSNTIDGVWLNRNYHLELNIEHHSDEGEKQIFNSKYILGKSKSTISDIIGYSSSAPITSELEAEIFEEKSNKDELAISLFYGTRMPYKSSNNYTQFLDVGFTSGIRFKFGKSMTVWDTKNIKLTINVTPVD